MKKLVLTLTAGAILASTAMANGNLTGDTKLACEALLCLSSKEGATAKECRPALKKYYSIKHKKSWKQAKKRRNFLKLCPKK